MFKHDLERNDGLPFIYDNGHLNVNGSIKAAQNFKKYISIADRKQAIKTASAMAEKGDILLIAGKGHEAYQEINGVRSHFDDFEIITETLKELQK